MAKLTFRMYILIIALLLALLMISPKFTDSVIIKEVKTNSTAFNQGIKPGMVLQELNSKQIKSIEDYTLALQQAVPVGNETRINIRADNQNFVFLSNNFSDLVVENEQRTKIKTGLDLSGGIRAILKPENISLTD